MGRFNCNKAEVNEYILVSFRRNSFESRRYRAEWAFAATDIKRLKWMQNLTPLQCAVAMGKIETVKILLDRKANPNAVCHHTRYIFGDLHPFGVVRMLKSVAQALEIVALHGNHKGVMILLPGTSPIINHARSEEWKDGHSDRENRRKRVFCCQNLWEKKHSRERIILMQYIGTQR